MKDTRAAAGPKDLRATNSSSGGLTSHFYRALNSQGTPVASQRRCASRGRGGVVPEHSSTPSMAGYGGMDVFNIRRSRGKHALVLSVSGHENNTVSNLYNPDIDAAKLKATLLKLGGWTVQMVADRGLEQTKKKIKEFAALRARGDDDCLFAFVGHGIELNDRNYLVAADSKLDPTYSTEATFEQAVKRECLPFEDVQVAFKNARESSAGATVFLLDCCRIGVSTSVGSGRVAGGFTSRAADSSVIRPQFPHTMVVYSTTSGNVASDGLPSDGGAFMGIFCEEVASGAAVAAVMQNTLRRLLEWGSHIC